MVFVIHSNSFEVELDACEQKSKKNKIPLKGFPTFYSENGVYITPLNLWMNFLVNVKHSKDLSSPVRALKRYWRFLELNQFSWNEFPNQRVAKPTYRYRNDNLLRAVRSGDLAASTASIYMQHVVKFYEWATYENMLSVSETSRPFNYEVVKIPNGQMMRHNKPYFSIRSTDLRIRVPDKSNKPTLCPLTQSEIVTYLNTLQQMSVEFKLHQLLQLNTGLRVAEACTFPLSCVIAPPYSSKRFDIKIGPANGVKTKYGATRVIEITHILMHELYKYSISERRQNRKQKALTDKGNQPLLLNREGQSFSSNSVQEHFGRLKKAINNSSQYPFHHRTHDLRSTYGTYRLASLIDNNVPESDAIALIMGWMGHKSESTTWQYVKFLQKETIRQDSLSMLDKFMGEALAQ